MHANRYRHFQGGPANRWRTYVRTGNPGRIKPELTKTDHQFFLVGIEPKKPAHLAHIDLTWLGSQQAAMLPRPPACDFEYYPDVAEAKLDLLYYVQPWMGQIRDIPYISTVWDLADRIYPFFPEVSLYGEFGRREDMYRRYLQRASYVIT